MATVLTDMTLEEQSEEILRRDGLFEIIDGEVVEIPRMGAKESDLANVLHEHIFLYTQQNKLGRARVEILFDFTAAIGRQRRPDLSFVSANSWPLSKPIPSGNAWKVVPELAVEVVSPTNRADLIVEKVDDYFQVGVQCVWVVYSSRSLIHVYTSQNEMRVYRVGDDLVGEPVLTGFRLPLAELFPHAA
ncbi:MAG: Uma2 family endonuclease [Planctomycetota bacterium]|nr:Uma2 family endonuclease [Planctomycetota bacterium]